MKIVLGLGKIRVTFAATNDMFHRENLVLKILDGKTFTLCCFGHKLFYIKQDILGMSWRIVSQNKLFFVLFYVCRIEKWCFTLTELASQLEG